MAASKIGTLPFDWRKERSAGKCISFGGLRTGSLCNVSLAISTSAGYVTSDSTSLNLYTISYPSTRTWTTSFSLSICLCPSRNLFSICIYSSASFFLTCHSK